MQCHGADDGDDDEVDNGDVDGEDDVGEYYFGGCRKKERLRGSNHSKAP